MNNERRTQIAGAVSELSDIHGFIDSLKDDEQEYFDNMPESFQNSEKGEAAQAAVDAFDSALASIDEAKDFLETAQE